MMDRKAIIKMSPYVNCIYSLAMIVEGISIDLGYTNMNKYSSLMRGQVIVRAEDFGDWSDLMERKVLSLDYEKDDIMNACIEFIYQLSKKVEAYFRRFDPKFDFYQRKEIAAMRVEGIDQNCYNDLKELIYKNYLK